MQTFSRPNTRAAANRTSLVNPSYPGKKLTETTIATCAVAPRPALVEFTELPCGPCHARAEAERQRWIARNPVPVTGTHNPYAKVSANSNKKNKQAGAPVKRTAPEQHHALPGNRVAIRVHNPYAVPCDNGICTGQCPNGSCTAGIHWNGVCTEQDICKMLGAHRCICRLTEAVPKCMVACLDWVNCGKCDPRKRGFDTCPFAHPDLTQVHPDVCCNFFLTGICRFHNPQEQTVAAIDVQQKKSNGKGRSDCTGCHCAAPEAGAFPLLPGLTKKILRPLRTEGTGPHKTTVEWDCSDLDRALAFYEAYLNCYRF